MGRKRETDYRQTDRQTDRDRGNKNEIYTKTGTDLYKVLRAVLLTIRNFLESPVR